MYFLHTQPTFIRTRGYLGFHKGLAFHLAAYVHLCSWSWSRRRWEGPAMFGEGEDFMWLFIGWASEKWEAVKARCSGWNQRGNFWVCLPPGEESTNVVAAPVTSFLPSLCPSPFRDPTLSSRCLTANSSYCTFWDLGIQCGYPSSPMILRLQIQYWHFMQHAVASCDKEVGACWRIGGMLYSWAH